LRLLSAPSGLTQVRLAGREGLALRPERTRNLWPLPTTQVRIDEGEYTTDKSDYGGGVGLWQDGANVDGRGLTLAEGGGRSFRFHATLDFDLRQHELRTVKLRLRHWEDDQVKLEEASGARPRVERSRDETGQVWTLTLPPGVAGRYRVKLTGSKPLKPGAEVFMPDVSVEGARRPARSV